MQGPRRRWLLPSLRLSGDSQLLLAEEERTHLPNLSRAPPGHLGGSGCRWLLPRPTPFPQPAQCQAWERAAELSPLSWPGIFPIIQNFWWQNWESWANRSPYLEAKLYPFLLGLLQLPGTWVHFSQAPSLFAHLDLCLSIWVSGSLSLPLDPISASAPKLADVPSS